MTRVDARIDDIMMAHLGGKGPSEETQELKDFRALVKLLDLPRSERKDSEGRIAELAHRILIGVETSNRVNTKPQVVSAFHILRQTKPVIASRMYKRFISTDVLDRDSLRSTLGLPQRRGRKNR